MRYYRPRTLDAAIDFLGADADARCLAGGATLVAKMNADLLKPSALISPAAIDELRGIDVNADAVRIGAMTRHADTAAHPRLTGALALLRRAAQAIGTPAIRAVGTIGGSLAYADPAADLPTALLALDARIEISGQTGTRQVDASAFFKGYYTTELAPGDIVTAVRIDRDARFNASAYRKITRTEGDFAIASLALYAGFEHGVCRIARVCVGGCGATPICNDAVNALLSGSVPDDARLARAAEQLAAACDPIDDVRGSAAYRRLLVKRLLPHVFMEAAHGLSHAG
jgi:carbon-monoxide dehydrogenase medium subunit